MLYPGSVPRFRVTWADPDRIHFCPAPARRGATRPSRAMALALALLAAVAASAGGRLAAADPASDLVVTMTASPLFVPVGGEITFRIDVTNQGPDLAPDVMLTDPLPPGLAFIAASVSHGHTELSQRTLVGFLGALEVGDTTVVTLVVTATEAGQFKNGAAVHSDNRDPNLDNNVAFYPASAGPPPLPPPPSPQPSPPPPPPPPCAVDQTAAIKVIPGLLGYNPNTQRFFLPVEVANISKQPIVGPVWLVLDNLAPIVLTNADGVTACQAPLGSPYLQINVGADGVLQPQEVVTATLGFAIPAGHGLTYRIRVLTGTGER